MSGNTVRKPEAQATDGTALRTEEPRRGTSHKPWYRKPRDTWYVEIAGQQVSLCKRKRPTIDFPRERLPFDGYHPNDRQTLHWAELLAVQAKILLDCHSPFTFRELIDDRRRS